jgi:ribose transport system permease protein
MTHQCSSPAEYWAWRGQVTFFRPQESPREVCYACQELDISRGKRKSVLLGLLVSVFVSALIGLINGAGIAFLTKSPFVMTLRMSGAVTGTIVIVNQGSVSGKVAPIMTRLIARPLSPEIPIPNVIIIWLIFGILMWLQLERTTFGKNLFAIGVNRVTARLSGVNVTGMNLATYTLAGALAGFGGFLVVGNTGVVFIAMGQPFLFPSVAAVAVGGTLLSGSQGSYWGTMAGAIVLTLITSLLTTMQIPESVRCMVLGGTLLILISIYGRQRALRR